MKSRVGSSAELFGFWGFFVTYIEWKSVPFWAWVVQVFELELYQYLSVLEMKFSDVPVVRSCLDYSMYLDRSVFVDFEVVFGVVLGLLILEIRLRSIKKLKLRLTWWMSHLWWDPMMGISGRIMR